MAFEGWLIKINGTVFPTRLIALESYKCTAGQIMDLDPYRDGDGVLHRNVLPHTATSIEFSTMSLQLKDTEVLNAFIAQENRVQCTVEYWNPNAAAYGSGTFYISDVPYEITRIDEVRKEVLYKPVKVTLTEY